MIEAARQYLKKVHFGTVLGVLAALYIAFYLAQTVKHNYDMQQQIGKLQQQITDLQIQKDQLKYKIQYYQTDTYKEKEARAKLGLQAPGEGVVILPHKDQSESTGQQQSKTATKPKKSNPQQWVDFLLGRT